MAKEYAKDFYYSTKWKKCRRGFMSSKHYICERCGRPAKIVHHKIHITPMNINDPEITLNWNNLQALCHECHNIVHGSEATIKEVSFDENGDLIYTPQISEDD